MQNLRFHLVLLLSFLLIGCSSSSTNNQPKGNTTSLAGIEEMGTPMPRGGSESNVQKKKIRYQAVQDTALALGAQSGLAWESRNIDEQLEQQAATLEKIYNFNALILDHDILPPVLLESRNILHLADTNTIRIADRRFKILRQAHFITTAPNWRQYLWMDYMTPERPSDSLLPEDNYEQEIWDYYAALGWEQGIQQAGDIFSNNVARLKEDFSGMILYRKLLAQNMVSPPYVANTDLGITGDSAEINIDDRVLRITALPQLNTDSSQWNAVVAENKAALVRYDNMEKLAEEHTLSLTEKVTSDTWHPVISNMSGHE